jgi:hypothetical protein
MLIASDCIHKLPPFVVDSLSSILLVGGSFFILSDFALASPLRGQAKFGVKIYSRIESIGRTVKVSLDRGSWNKVFGLK